MVTASAGAAERPADQVPESRVNRIPTRLGLENRVQAAIVAYEAGLLDT